LVGTRPRTLHRLEWAETDRRQLLRQPAPDEQVLAGLVDRRRLQGAPETFEQRGRRTVRQLAACGREQHSDGRALRGGRGRDLLGSRLAAQSSLLRVAEPARRFEE